MDPYWKVRAQSFFFSLDVIGEKSALIERVEQILYDNYLYKKNPEEANRDLSDTDIETLVKNTKRAPKNGLDVNFAQFEEDFKDGTFIG